MTVEKITYEGWNDCIRLHNSEVELIVTTVIGPRIVFFGYINQQNLFHLTEEDRGKSGGDKWRIYGGHRLWLAPENIPLSFYPDNIPVGFSYENGTLKLTQEKESTTGIIKEMEITLSGDSNTVKVHHRLSNQGSKALDVSVWALSVLAQGGRAIAPQEPYGEGDDYLLPARPLALWQYTRMNDRRWTWGDRYIQAKHIPELTSEQKIGISNKERWVAFYLNGQVLIKEFPFDPVASYPDFGCNNELYINGSFLEVETLGPLVLLNPGQQIEHTENWLLAKCIFSEEEKSIEDNLLPVVKKFLGSML
jgi:hypothetical protein